MEKRTTNLTIEDFEDKKFGEGKNAGRYTRFKTSEGWISSFDKPTIEKLKDAEGEWVCVEIATDKNDKEKITKFLGDAKEDAEDEVLNVPVEKVGESKSVKGSAYEKDPVGLAVEIFCALMPVADKELPEIKPGDMGKILMERAILFVKQAQKAFE